MTYSIVARDPESGALGVAVQTAMFGVGSIVPWARAGVGAVATQAMGEPAYGPRCLDALESGASAGEALASAQACDPAPFLRQVGVVSADGSVAATTGDMCIDHAGHVVGDGFAVQANMMATVDVWPAMADAFERSSTEKFPHRLLAALDAAQAAGGDARGMMSAALVVVAAERADPWSGLLKDLRVDRSDDPLRELRRLLDASEAFGAFNRAVGELFAGMTETALVELDRALELLPGEENMRFLRAGALLARNDVDGARAELQSLVAQRPSWEVIARSFAAKGFFAGQPSVSIDDLLA